MPDRVDMDTIVSLCKRRGFVYPAAEIYGGFANAWDYGPLGVEMRRNIRDAWWRATVRERDDVVGGDGLGERAAELAVGSGDQDAATPRSRSERIGDRVLHRSTTRGSFHGTPCSSGSRGSYSSVTR